MTQAPTILRISSKIHTTQLEGEIRNNITDFKKDSSLNHSKLILHNLNDFKFVYA